MSFEGKVVLITGGSSGTIFKKFICNIEIHLSSVFDKNENLIYKLERIEFPYCRTFFAFDTNLFEKLLR